MEDIKQSHNVDAFVTILRYVHEERMLEVHHPLYCRNPSDSFYVFIREQRGREVDLESERMQGNLINSVMEQRIPVGSTVMISAMTIPNTEAIADRSRVPANWVNVCNQDAKRRANGFITFKGFFPVDEKYGEKSLQQVGYWRAEPMAYPSKKATTFCEMLDKRVSLIQKYKSIDTQSTLPYFGYMLRAEVGSELVEYTAPVSMLSEITLNKKETGKPISSSVFMNQVESFSSACVKRFGEEVKVSVLGYSNFFAGNGVRLNRQIEKLATFNPVRGDTPEKNGFGGHMLGKMHGAISMTKNKAGGGKQVMRMFADKVSVNGRQAITALHLPSPYTNAVLRPAAHLETDKRKATQGGYRSGSSSVASTEASSKKMLLDDGVFHITDNKDIARLKEISSNGDSSDYAFVDVGRGEDGGLVGIFRKSDRFIAQTEDRLVRTVAAYKVRGVDVNEEEIALRAIDAMNRGHDSRRSMTNVSQADDRETSTAKVINHPANIKANN